MANSINFGKRYEDDHAYFGDPVRFRFVQLHQIGELCCEAGYEIGEHPQTVFEITYIVTGKGTIRTDGKAFPVEENSVFINAVGQMHAICADRGTPLRFCYLGFAFVGRTGETAELERFFRSWNGTKPFVSKELLVLFSRVSDEFSERRDGYMAMIGAYVEQIVVEAYRSYCEQHAGRTAGGGERIGNAAYTLVRYVDRHFRDIDDYRELAARLGYSYTYLAHTFKEKTGVTIGEYIIAKKMEEAKWLLRTGRMTVSQIAARLNYRSVQSFSNSFKKSVGLSPAEFQALPAEKAAAYIRHL